MFCEEMIYLARQEYNANKSFIKILTAFTVIKSISNKISL